MDDVIAWCGFAGAWLLFVGPLYQAVLELHEQDLERDRIAATKKSVPKPPEISRWWWLLPPVHYLLGRRRMHAHQQVVMASMDPADVQDLVHYLSKAIGWLLVGLGGLLLAVKETYELRERYEWSAAVFWIVAAAMLLLSTSYAVGSRGRLDQMKAAGVTTAGDSPG